MALSYSELQTKAFRMLDDPEAQIYTEDLVWDGVCAAHDALMPYIPKTAVMTFATSGSGGDYTLPEDLYLIQAVQRVETLKFIPKANLAPGSIRSENVENNDWIEYPQGVLSLSAPLDEGALLKLYYFAYWQKPASETDLNFVIEVPPAAYYGVLLYAASHCLLAKAANSANIRQFNVRVDSGNPEDNPLKRQAETLRHLFYQEMKMMPPYAKAGP